MNTYLVSEYLQLLRKRHSYTQEDLAHALSISRQAVSKWETGNTIPDIEILLKLSKLYNLTINDILEPNIQSKDISNFEDIIKISKEELKELLSKFDISDIIKAAMGSSPEVNDFLQNIFADTDFQKEQIIIGRVKAEEIEDIQNQIVSIINLDRSK